jgi:5-methylcytosine-specific restriction endonuclease McrA
MLGKEEYRQALLSPEWRTVKELILDRDNHNCQTCSIKIGLEVHHRYYYGKMPWDTPHEYLITLCKTCHEKAHKGRKIESFRAPTWLPIHKSKQLTPKRIKDLKKRDMLILKLRIKKH